jgi:signal transduction histidine kinase
MDRVTAQPAMLRQALTNLLENALKFRAADRELRILVRTEDAGNENVRIWVEDNGIGIDPENHEKIFGIFERLHSESEFEGTGIGLAIVAKSLQRMGGSCGVESERGNGSRFWLELPAGAVAPKRGAK